MFHFPVSYSVMVEQLVNLLLEARALDVVLHRVCLFFPFSIQFDVTAFDAVESLHGVTYELFSLLQCYFCV